MHRSANTTRTPDEFHLGVGVAAVGMPPSGGGNLGASPGGGGLLESAHLPVLPKYDTQSSLAKKAAARARSAEAAVHLIPLVLIACAAVLWFFSSPTQLPQIDATTSKGGSMADGIANTTIQGLGDDNTNSSPLEDVLAAERRVPDRKQMQE